MAYDKWLALAFRLDLKTEVARIPLTPWMVLVPAMLAIAAVVAVYQIVLVATGRPATISARQAGPASSAACRSSSIACPTTASADRADRDPCSG